MPLSKTYKHIVISGLTVTLIMLIISSIMKNSSLFQPNQNCDDFDNKAMEVLILEEVLQEYYKDPELKEILSPAIPYTPEFKEQLREDRKKMRDYTTMQVIPRYVSLGEAAQEVLVLKKALARCTKFEILFTDQYRSDTRIVTNAEHTMFLLSLLKHVQAKDKGGWRYPGGDKYIFLYDENDQDLLCIDVNAFVKSGYLTFEKDEHKVLFFNFLEKLCVEKI